MRHSGGTQSKLQEAIGSEVKGIVSIVMYVAGMGLAFVNQWLSDAIYIAVALMWLVPDRRIERRVA